MARQGAQTQDKGKRIERFLAELSSDANVSAAANAIGVSRRTVYDWREADPEFAKRWDAAVEIGLDALEDEAARRGMRGYEEITIERVPIGTKGRTRRVETKRVRKYSDTLLMFMLNGRRGHVFKNRHEHTGHGGGPIQTVTRTIVDPKAGDDDGSGGTP